MKNPDKKIIEEILSDYQKSVARLVLFCLNEIPEAQGIKKTIDILKGTRSSYLVNHNLVDLASFSSLNGFTRDQLFDILDILIIHGYIELQLIDEDGEEYMVLVISSKGEEFLKNPANQDFQLLDVLMDKDVDQIPEDDQDLFYKIKLARRQLAEEYDIPAFMVCNDTILKEMCLKKPMETDELESIKGVDEDFMENYSKQFLYVIRQYVIREKGT
jgi:ATP-dependent DNA helicase RecQ